MKTILRTLFLFLLTLPISAQGIFLSASGKTAKETAVLDSLKYQKNHSNEQNATDEIKTLANKLSKAGYINNQYQIESLKKDTLYSQFNLNNQIKKIHLYIDPKNGDTKNIDIKTLFKERVNDTVSIAYAKINDYLTDKYNELASTGYPFAKLTLKNIHQNNEILVAELHIQSEKKRQINSIIYTFLTNKKHNSLPKTHQKFIAKKFIGKEFTKKNIESLNQTISELTFVNQTKYPEALFKNDSTIIYTYLEKQNSNNFDGYIGFSNDKAKKLKLSGYLNIQLENILQTGEQFSLYWKNDNQQQKTFNTNLEIPFLFGTPFLIAGELNIFTADSTFQNTKTSIGFGYLFNLQSKIKLVHKTTQSTDVQQTNTAQIIDFKSTLTSLQFNHTRRKQNENYFNSATTFELSLGYGSRKTATNNSKQTHLHSYLSHTFKIDSKNFLKIINFNYILNSNILLTNELYRFGGMNSIRGFTENSLQANYVSYVQTEYWHLLNPSLLINTVFDFGIYQDKTYAQDSNSLRILKSFGFEINLKTKSNIIKLSLINGSTNDQKIKFYNTILNICYNVKF